MARQKRSSRILEKAQRRLASIQSIDAKLTLDGGISIQTYAKVIGDLRSQLDSYNTALSTIDDLYNNIADAERQLADYSEQMLLGVAAKFGKNSNQYEMAGGVRKRDRKRPVRRAIAAKAG
ncbi:MAG: hypothetical protein WA885_13500 [Phormidesmis sp.]